MGRFGCRASTLFTMLLTTANAMGDEPSFCLEPFKILQRGEINGRTSTYDFIPADYDADGDTDFILQRSLFGDGDHEADCELMLLENKNNANESSFDHDNFTLHLNVGNTRGRWRGDCPTLRAADVNSDSRPDLVGITSREVSGGSLPYQFWLENVDGLGRSFSSQFDGNLFDPISDVRVVDLDLDSDSDLISLYSFVDFDLLPSPRVFNLTWHENINNVTESLSGLPSYVHHEILYNNGTLFDDPLNDRFSSIFVGDVDGDADMDIVAAGTHLGIFENLFYGGGSERELGEIVNNTSETNVSFAPLQILQETRWSKRLLGLKDFDADGDLDLMVIFFDIHTTYLGWHENLNSGTNYSDFQALITNTSADVLIEDFDSDSLPDVIYASKFDEDQILYHRNFGRDSPTGDVVLGAAVVLDTHAGQNYQMKVEESVAVDLDQDGRLDLVWRRPGFAHLMFSRNVECTPTPTSPPTATPTSRPTSTPTSQPTLAPTSLPTSTPTSTLSPTLTPTQAPITAMTTSPTLAPTSPPTSRPTSASEPTSTTPPSETISSVSNFTSAVSETPGPSMSPAPAVAADERSNVNGAQRTFGSTFGGNFLSSASLAIFVALSSHC